MQTKGTSFNDENTKLVNISTKLFLAFMLIIQATSVIIIFYQYINSIVWFLGARIYLPW